MLGGINFPQTWLKLKNSVKPAPKYVTGWIDWLLVITTDISQNIPHDFHVLLGGFLLGLQVVDDGGQAQSGAGQVVVKILTHPRPVSLYWAWRRRGQVGDLSRHLPELGDGKYLSFIFHQDVEGWSIKEMHKYTIYYI